MVVQQTDVIYNKMKKELELLQKISANTKIQIQFIHQRKMKGLLRLVNERGQYLQELAVLNHGFDSDAVDITANGEFKSMLLEIKKKQREILQDNEVALTAAKEEQEHIAADLRRVNSRKKLRESYGYQGIKFSGNRLNQEG